MMVGGYDTLIRPGSSVSVSDTQGDTDTYRIRSDTYPVRIPDQSCSLRSVSREHRSIPAAPRALVVKYGKRRTTATIKQVNGLGAGRLEGYQLHSWAQRRRRRRQALGAVPPRSLRATPSLLKSWIASFVQVASKILSVEFFPSMCNSSGFVCVFLH